MAKDLIIGGASNYNWNQLRYWVNSIKKTGFKGDIVLVVTNMSAETVNKLTEEDVRQHCKQYLTAYKVPKIVEFYEKLPKSNVGKILRRELR